MNGRYVVSENGDRVAVLLDIAEYERMVALVSDEEPEDEHCDPEEAERRITEFITSAENLPGPPVAELVEQVSRVVRLAWSEVEEIMAGKPHNKVLATQLSLGQQARELQPEKPEYWQSSAAGTLLSGMISKAARDGDG